MNPVIDVLAPTERPLILLAEDDPDQSDSLREVLELEGYDVETVFSGDMALLRLMTRNFTAAIMDARMPGINGGAVMKTCRARNPKFNTPIVMVSAFASPRDLDQYKKEGAAASFAKPLDVSNVLKYIRQLTDKKQRASVPCSRCESASASTPELKRAEHDIPFTDCSSATKRGCSDGNNLFSPQSRYASSVR